MFKRLLAVVIFFLVFDSAGAATNIPEGFVDISSLDDSILIEARYFTAFNFVGAKIDGYHANKCYLTKAAAQQLAKVQKDLRTQKLGLKIFDCYRPQKAVNHFVRWAKDSKDTKMKIAFYPNEKKGLLFQRGYIASKSGHSRGSTVDLTLVPLHPQKQTPYPKPEDLQSCTNPRPNRFADNSLDMGSGYDCLDVKSNTLNPNIPKTAKKNRQILVSAMKKHGFRNYSKEWWHFTLNNEPYSNKYFDFDVR